MRWFKRKLDSGHEIVYNKDWRWHQGYDEGFNNGYLLGQLEKTNYRVDNNIVNAWDEFHKPRFVREINEIGGEL